MPITFVEDNDSRSATIYRRGTRGASTYSKSWKAFGTSDDSELHASINAQISTGGYGWQYPGVADAQLYVESYSVAYLGDDAWQVTAQYQKTGVDAVEETPMKRSRSFDTTGGTQHLTQAKAESRFGTGAPDMSMAIGVDSNGVNGVDVVIPQLQWSEAYDVPSTYVTDSYIRGVSGITGMTNNATFRGFEVGEVLFMGCSGSHEWDTHTGNGPWSLSFRFVASKNVTAQAVGDMSVNKKGHEYLWVRYEDAVSGGTSLLKKPKYAYVNQVYASGSFSSLGIG